jgi:protoporphyrinogen oxidase
MWTKPDADLVEQAKQELEALGLGVAAKVEAGYVVRMPKAYPVYDELHVLRAFADRIPNLYLIGRNGMHRYNNQDHSMLTAMQAVDHAARGIASKDAIWDVNVGDDYHEER